VDVNIWKKEIEDMEKNSGNDKNDVEKMINIMDMVYRDKKK
jgi:hypothetical protein